MQTDIFSAGRFSIAVSAGAFTASDQRPALKIAVWTRKTGSRHDEVLDAAITYKINGTYPSNSLKDRNAWLHQRIHAVTDFL